MHFTLKIQWKVGLCHLNNEHHTCQATLTTLKHTHVFTRSLWAPIDRKNNGYLFNDMKLKNIDWCEWNLRTQFGCVMNFPLWVFVCLPDVCTDVLVKQHHCREYEKPTQYKSRSRATVHSLTYETRPTIGALSSTTEPTDEWKSLTLLNDY